MTDYHRGRLIRLRASLSERATEYAERTGRPVVEVIDQAVRDHLDRQDEKEQSRMTIPAPAEGRQVTIDELAEHMGTDRLGVAAAMRDDPRAIARALVEISETKEQSR